MIEAHNQRMRSICTDNRTHETYHHTRVFRRTRQRHVGCNVPRRTACNASVSRVTHVNRTNHGSQRRWDVVLSSIQCTTLTNKTTSEPREPSRIRSDAFATNTATIFQPSRTTVAHAKRQHERMQHAEALVRGRNNPVDIHPHCQRKNERRPRNGGTKFATTKDKKTRRRRICNGWGWSCVVSFVAATEHYDVAPVDVAASSSAMALAGSRSSCTCLLDTSTAAGAA